MSMHSKITRMDTVKIKRFDTIKDIEEIIDTSDDDCTIGDESPGFIKANSTHFMTKEEEEACDVGGEGSVTK